MKRALALLLLATGVVAGCSIERLRPADSATSDSSTVVAADSVLRMGYRRDSLYRWQNNLLPLKPETLYVAEARDRFVNGYRSRGAYGLGWIHTPRAVAYLDSAAQLPNLPPSVKQAVLYARDSLPPPP